MTGKLLALFIDGNGMVAVFNITVELLVEMLLAHEPAERFDRVPYADEVRLAFVAECILETCGNPVVSSGIVDLRRIRNEVAAAFLQQTAFMEHPG